jgi:phospholipase D-like protein
MALAADYPFLGIFWSMLIFFAWLAWFWMIIIIFGDIFRRSDIGGWAKTAWCFFMIILPFLGVFIYLIAQHKGIAQRRMEDAQSAQRQFDDRIRTVATSSRGAAEEITQAQGLLNSGAIDQNEFDRLKAKALA